MESKYQYDNYNIWKKIIIWFFFISGVVFFLLIGLTGMDNAPEGMREIGKVVFSDGSSVQFRQNHRTLAIINSICECLPVAIMLLVSSNILGNKFALLNFIGIGDESIGNLIIPVMFAILLEIITFGIGVYFDLYDFSPTFLYEVFIIILMASITMPDKVKDE